MVINSSDDQTSKISQDNESLVNENIRKSKDYVDKYLIPIVHKCGEPLEGNIFMLHKTTNHTDRFSSKVKNLSTLTMDENITNVVEIGFNAGFSALLMLISNPKIQMTCFDLGKHSYVGPCFEKLKETFGDRINLILGDSMKTLPCVEDTYDMIHIDGGHSTLVAESDIKNCYRLSKTGTILIMDDYDFPNIKQLWNEYCIKYDLCKLDKFLYASPHHDIRYVKSKNNY